MRHAKDAEERILAILAKRKERDEQAERATDAPEQECPTHELSVQFLRDVVPVIAAVQAWADAIIRRDGYSLLQITNHADGRGAMPYIAYQLNGGCALYPRLSSVQPAGPPVIDFALNQEGNVLVSIAGLPHALIEIGDFTRDTAIAEFERLIRFAVLDE